MKRVMILLALLLGLTVSLRAQGVKLKVSGVGYYDYNKLTWSDWVGTTGEIYLNSESIKFDVPQYDFHNGDSIYLYQVVEQLGDKYFLFKSKSGIQYAIIHSVQSEIIVVRLMTTDTGLQFLIYTKKERNSSTNTQKGE